MCLSLSRPTEQPEQQVEFWEYGDKDAHQEVHIVLCGAVSHGNNALRSRYKHCGLACHRIVVLLRLVGVPTLSSPVWQDFISEELLLYFYFEGRRVCLMV